MHKSLSKKKCQFRFFVSNKNNILLFSKSPLYIVQRYFKHPRARHVGYIDRFFIVFQLLIQLLRDLIRFLTHSYLFYWLY